MCFFFHDPTNQKQKQGLFTRVTPCHITTFYYVGFCYLMMRRYQDAAKTFSHILYFISRTKQYHTRSFQYDFIMKQNEQMYALLAVSLSLSPQRIEDSVQTSLREKVWLPFLFQPQKILFLIDNHNHDKNNNKIRVGC